MRPGSVETTEQEKVVQDYGSLLWTNFSTPTDPSSPSTSEHSIDKYRPV